MLNLQVIQELRSTLNDTPITVIGRTKAFNLVALYQALDREEAEQISDNQARSKEAMREQVKKELEKAEPVPEAAQGE